MADYQLNLSFTQQNLETFYATGTNVVLAKPAANGTATTQWVVFKPLMNNTVTWEEQYGIYASMVPSTQGGATLTQTSLVPLPAAIGKLYKLGPSGSIKVQPDGGTPNAFSLNNEYPAPAGFMTVGLYQNAVANGANMEGNAISAAGTLYKSTAVMTPYTTLYVWMQSQITSNTVATRVTSPQTKVDFGGGTNIVSLSYDKDSGTFIAPAGDKLGSGISLAVREPLL
jgi:hypothetical protein